jgi:hypothetical protein
VTAFKSGYQETAIEQDTFMNGGLILSSVIGARDNGVVRSYMNGLEENPTAFAAGVTDFGAPTETKKIALQHDGSGHLAGGNINWDAAGNLKVSGLLSSGFREVLAGWDNYEADVVSGIISNVYVVSTNAKSNVILKLPAGAVTGYRVIVINSDDGTPNIENKYMTVYLNTVGSARIHTISLYTNTSSYTIPAKTLIEVVAVSEIKWIITNVRTFS